MISMAQWAIRWRSDGSIRTGFNGPRARSYCEAEVMRIPGTEVVSRSSIAKGEWQQVNVRNRFTIRDLDDTTGMWKNHALLHHLPNHVPVQAVCPLCLYLSAASLTVFGPVRAFEDHWHDKHIQPVVHAAPPRRRRLLDWFRLDHDRRP